MLDGELKFEKAVLGKLGHGAKSHSMTFLDALELEYLRLEYGVSPIVRDCVLHRLAVDINMFNPNYYIVPYRPTQTRNVKYKGFICQVLN